MSESTITIEELRRRVEQTDVETLQVIHAMLREARHNQRRSFVTAVITAALGIVTAVSALLPSANTAWALISAAAIAIVLGYWSYANSRRLAMRRTLRILDEANGKDLRSAAAEQLRKKVIQDIFGPEAR